MTQHPTLSRRAALLGGVGLLGASQLRATPAAAQGTTTLSAGAQVPGAYRLKVGSLGAAVVSDGTVRLEPALPTVSPTADLPRSRRSFAPTGCPPTAWPPTAT